MQFRVQAKPGDVLTYSVRVAYKTAPGGKPLPKAVLAYAAPAAPPHAACAGPVALTLQHAGTTTLRRAVDKSGRDRFCLRLGAIPANVLALTITISAQVKHGTAISKPSISVLTLARTLRLVTTVAVGMLKPSQAQRVQVKTAPGTTLVYHLTYGSQTKPSLTVVHVAGKTGVDTLSFKVGYTPSRSDGVAPASLSVVGSLFSVIKGHSASRFQVVRPDAVLVLKKLVLQVLTPVVKSGAMVKLQTLSARAAYLLVTLTYGGKRSKVTYAVVADGSGYATLSFAAAYKPPKGAKVPATISITAEQGRARVTAVAKFTVQG
jgi:hypothetical protein